MQRLGQGDARGAHERAGNTAADRVHQRGSGALRCTSLTFRFVNPFQVPHIIDTISKSSAVGDRIKIARSTPETAFIDSNVHDDARQGIATLTEMEESATIMVSMISELRILFGLNIGFAFFVLYYATFLRTISNVVHQVLHALRDAVLMLAISHCVQARLSRIFLATIPMESISKVRC